MVRPPLEKNEGEWQPISTAPLDLDLELGILVYDGIHALIFPCRRIPKTAGIGRKPASD